MHRREQRRWWQFLLLQPARCVCNMRWPCIETRIRIRMRAEEHRTRTAVSDPPNRSPSRIAADIAGRPHGGGSPC